ncbi:hypothetical protein OIU84_026960 [Salix udensis]|uniref:Uncharacterized protein n=1 Tax=Salix udensis TaxID=889485 RepID=A0AAD6KEC9_9ROSI|nr:hypothetical protein OIU84_026960 [Salix udensis]
MIEMNQQANYRPIGINYYNVKNLECRRVTSRFLL